MKKVLAVLVSLIMIFSVSVCAFAATTGTITITNAVENQTYTAYKVFDLVPSTDGGSYLYKVKGTWEAVFSDSECSKYFDVDSQNYVTWKYGENDPDTVQAVAKLLLEAARNNASIKGTTVTATGSTVTFDNLELGYYLVDSSLGSLCALTTTNPVVEINEKNEKPSLDKQVQEDSDSSWGAKNDDDIGKTINYKATITVQKGAENYVMHDKMDAGLTYSGVQKVTVNGVDVSAENYTVKTEALADDCTFEIEFKDEYVQSLVAGTQIVVEYSAVLNENATIGEDAPNVNNAHLSYGDKNNTSNKTPEEKTETYTYQFQLVKTKDDHTKIDGAKFKLYDAKEGGNEIKVVKVSEGVYRVAKEGEQGVEIEAGHVTIKGLDGSTTYYLEETQAPSGYNMISGRVEVTIAQENNNATVETDKYVSGGIEVVNKAGSLLPSTGGIGTTIFYIVGGLMMAAALILLVTKRRMASAN